jgi:hypothetical protein
MFIPMSGGYFIFVIPISSGYLKNFRIKEPPKIQAFEKIRTRESLGLGI